MLKFVGLLQHHDMPCLCMTCISHGRRDVSKRGKSTHADGLGGWKLIFRVVVIQRHQFCKRTILSMPQMMTACDYDWGHSSTQSYVCTGGSFYSQVPMLFSVLTHFLPEMSSIGRDA